MPSPQATAELWQTHRAFQDYVFHGDYDCTLAGASTKCCAKCKVMMNTLSNVHLLFLSTSYPPGWKSIDVAITQMKNKLASDGPGDARRQLGDVADVVTRQPAECTVLLNCPFMLPLPSPP